ncbi:hypothetical protein CDL15_Pgr005074 [Punica granatum]|uniref:Uncharacterized protein n=1 Tax=Punica granatum TaxID=22663 RepID=A0A218XCW7_PUNGR|nr:hypothetical protein CDL15_Pgr005074 [Punica granatum]
MLGRGPKAVNAGPRPDAGPKLKSGAEAQKWGRSPMRGRNAKAGPKLDAVNAGPEPDARPKAHASLVDAQGLAKRCASDHAVMFSVSKKLVSVSLTWEGESALDPQLALPWRKGEGRRWSTCEGWHDSPIMRGGWPGSTAFGHSTFRHGEVKIAGGLPAKVGTTRLSCGVGGRDGRPLVTARLTVER